jgi:hypothetical protein
MTLVTVVCGLRFWTVGPVWGGLSFSGVGGIVCGGDYGTVHCRGTSQTDDSTLVSLATHGSLRLSAVWRLDGGLMADIRNVDGKLGRMEGFTRVLVLRLGLKYLYGLIFDVVAICGEYVGD